MATFTTIADTVLEPGKPIRSVDTLALRDNPIAIAGGAAGAPKVVTNALATNERMTTANVLARTAAAALDAVGTYAFCLAKSSTVQTPGNTVAGSTLGYTNAGSGVFGGTPTGTWRRMGGNGNNNANPTVYLRIS